MIVLAHRAPAAGRRLIPVVTKSLALPRASDRFERSQRYGCASCPTASLVLRVARVRRFGRRPFVGAAGARHAPHRSRSHVRILGQGSCVGPPVQCASLLAPERARQGMTAMTKEEFNRLPMMLGMKQVVDCLGIARATVYRVLENGRMRPPVKIGCTNRWPKEYIGLVMQSGFDPPGTHLSLQRRDSGGREGAPASP